MIELLDDPTRFQLRAGPLIASRIENTVLATVLRGILDGRYADVPPRFAVVTGAEGEVIGAALRTPPMPLVTTALPAADATALMERWLAVDPEVTVVSAEAATARALADAAERVTGAAPALEQRMALHVVDAATLCPPPRPAAGELRPPSGDEVELYVEWERAFTAEAGIEVGLEVVARHARERIAAGRAYVWDDGAPVSHVGHTPIVAGVPRVGPVYTPPHRRGRGYASSAVHALTARLLDAGDVVRVVLFTDLANPTSNRIYADVGYRRIGDWEVYALRRGPTGSA